MPYVGLPYLELTLELMRASLGHMASQSRAVHQGMWTLHNNQAQLQYDCIEVDQRNAPVYRLAVKIHGQFKGMHISIIDDLPETVEYD